MKSLLLHTLVVSIATPVFAQSWPEPPPTTAASSTIKDCTYWNVVSSGQTCASIASDNGITLAQFKNYNPVVGTGSSCPLVVGNSYCVESNYGIPPDETTTTTTTSRAVTSASSSPSPTTTGNGIATPSPYQSGMVSNCNKFHFVTDGQGCPQIASLYGISTAQVIEYNPGVGSDCRFLWLDAYVCVGVIGGATSTTRASSTTRPTTTTTAGNGITTPSPYMPQSASNCNKFYFVKSGDSCPLIASAFNIPVAAVIGYNPAVGSDCQYLWLDTYICVGVIGGSTFTTTTTTTTRRPTTTAGNGITTPTPYLPGSATNCDAFYLVRSGDTCDTITSSKGVTNADFHKFNPQISSDCTTGLWLDTYVCISIVGHNLSISTTTTRRVTTTRGNGVVTPTPYQTPMVTNCKTFEYVDSGETCSSIAAARRITVANIVSWNPGVGSDCRYMWLNAYICVGLL